MAPPAAPPIECEQHHASLWVRDVDAAAEFYATRLGFSIGFTFGDPPTLAGVVLDRVQIFLERGSPEPQRGLVYFVVGDADELHGFHLANGVEVLEEPGDRDYGLRDYVIRDLDGNALSFGHRLPVAEPPLEIERVELSIRLEKRLAAALADLAKRKHMTVSSCLEETLLHTFEPFGGGVASPHTQGDLRFIQELKKKHGIDYDSHASYRFVERGSSRT